jgi:hypothetical protein
MTIVEISDTTATARVMRVRSSAYAPIALSANMPTQTQDRSLSARSTMISLYFGDMMARAVRPFDFPE